MNVDEKLDRIIALLESIERQIEINGDGGKLTSAGAQLAGISLTK